MFVGSPEHVAQEIDQDDRGVGTGPFHAASAVGITSGMSRFSSLSNLLGHQGCTARAEHLQLRASKTE